MAILYVLVMIVFLATLVCVAAVVKPFKPFKSRKMAMLASVIAFVVFAVVGNIQLTFEMKNPENIALAEVEVSNIFPQVKTALDEHNFSEATRLLKSVAPMTKNIKGAEIATLENKITAGEFLFKVDELVASKEQDSYEKIQNLIVLWSNFGKEIQAQKMVGPEFEAKLLSIVKSIPAHRVIANRDNYKLLIEIAIMNGNETEKYAEKLLLYEQKAQAKARDKIKTLDKRARDTAESNFYLKITQYKELVELAPDVERYQERLTYYEGIKRSGERAIRECEKNRTFAYLMAQSYIEQQLKSPSSAKFPSNGRVAVHSTTPCIYRIRSHVDAENSFGASLRSQWYVKLEHTANDKWKLLDIEIN